MKREQAYALITLAILGSGIVLFVVHKTDTAGPGKNADGITRDTGGRESEQGFRGVDFAAIDSAYRFSSLIPDDWRVEFVAQTSAINIYDPDSPEPTTLEQSQIFIRQFRADTFLTLPTVTILSRNATSVRNHETVRYEIIKKPDVANFADQPGWRSGRHKLIDIRFSGTNPGLFYVISYAPSLEADIFEKFIQDIQFHNDPASFVPPISKPLERADKKPFGLFVSPDSSPITPERFSGYHTGVDFEVSGGEQNQDVAIVSICGGTVRTKKSAGGYGGVVVQDCLLNNDSVTVVYGHVRLSSVRAKEGEYLSPGAFLGLLGTASSPETDNERKHLHLGVHRGQTVDIRGYTSSESELSGWMNPLDIFTVR